MSKTETIERQYALTKIRAGDYLLPSNDAKAIWRIRQYEDGPSYGLDDMPRDRTFWGVWKFRFPVDPQVAVDPDDPDHWSLEADWFDTRQQAIDYALTPT